MLSKAESARYTQLTDSQLSWVHMVYQWICIQLLKIYFNTCFQLHITGLENKPKGFQSYIVACNHSSLMDPPLCSVALDYQPIAYMAKMELFQKWGMRTYNWAMASFAVNREKLELSTVKTALRVLKTGKWALGIFPEGTRQKDARMSEAKRGVAYFAKSAKVPVLPMAVVHSEPSRGRKRIDVLIGKLIPPDPDMDAMTQKLQDAITGLIQEAHNAS